MWMHMSDNYFDNCVFVSAVGCWIRLLRHKYSCSNIEYICTIESVCSCRAPALGCNGYYCPNTVFLALIPFFSADPLFLSGTGMSETWGYRCTRDTLALRQTNSQCHVTLQFASLCYAPEEPGHPRSRNCL